MATCNPYVNTRFGRTYHFHLQDRKSAEQESILQQYLHSRLLHAGFLLG
jgi:hypothetical protein